MLKNKKSIRIILIIALILAGATCTNAIINHQRQPHTIEQQYIDEKDLLTNETIVNELKDNLRIDILDIYMNTNTTIDKSICDLGWFENIKDIKFYGKGTYSIDVKALNEECVRINENDVKIYLSKPIKQVELLEDKTEFKDTKGLLVFNDLEVTPEEYTNLQARAKNEMAAAMQKEEKEAMSKAEGQIKFLLSTLTREQYNIEIIWT